MESRTEAAADSSARTFSQVVFIDIPRSYPPSTPITCRYTLVAALKPSSRDWVGIFKVGWSTTKDYHTFVWVEPCLEVVGQQSMMRQAVFKEYYLPKDEIEFYQFCYVDSTGQVRGASTPFCFRNTAEQSTESSPDDDLLVITTQEQVEQSVREKTELQKEVVQMMEKNENLHRALQKEKQEVATLKEQNEQKEKEKTQLAKELEQMKGEKENLQSILQQNLREKDQLKAEMLTQMTEQMELKERNPAEQKERSQSLRLETASKQNEAHAQEKYDRAVMKINQLKEEREELRGRVDAQSEEISTLNFKIREKERELFKMKDGIQLMQVDLQSSEKENERLSAELQRLQSLTQNMADMEREMQELCRRLSQQEALQNPPDDDLRVRCQTLVCELRDAQAKLAAEREESRNSKMRAEFLDGELQQIRGQLEGLISSHEQAQQKSSKQELLLREAHETIADKDGVIEEKERMIVLMSQEKEELARENQNLISDVEGLRRVCDNLQAAAPAQSLYMHPDVTAADLRTPEQSDHLYETIGDPVEEQSLVCRHCQESFPCITREELEAHEQSHRICPFCTMICDAMEQSIFEDHVYGHEL